jgi:hypothetical protein
LLLNLGQGDGLGVLEIGVGGIAGADGVFEIVALGVECCNFLIEGVNLGFLTRLGGELDELFFFGF